MSQQRVSIRNKNILFLNAVISQCLDDYSQISQTLVDVVGLLQSHTSCTSFWLTFRACQIDYIEFGLNGFSFANFSVVYGKNCMTSRRVLVHGMCSNDSDFLSILEHFQNFVIWFTKDWVHTWYKDWCPCRLNFDLVLFIGIQKVS